MKIRITFDLDLDDRAALAYYYGSPRPADRSTITTFIEATIQTILDDLRTDLLDAGDEWPTAFAEFTRRTREGIAADKKSRLDTGKKARLSSAND